MPSRRVRQHVNPLRSEFFTIRPPRIVVPEGRTLEVELGSAEGLFLLERAAEEPKGYYVGVEIRREMVVKAEKAARRRGVSDRVLNVYANMNVDLPHLFAAGSVQRFFLNFPDPWWKAWQRKRRVAGAELVDALYEYLVPGGEVQVATDIYDIALEMLAALEDQAPERFVNLAGEWSFLKRRPCASRSRREQQCEGDGSTVWRVGFRKVAAAASLTTESARDPRAA